MAAFGGVHVLCNNAGVYRGGPLDAMTYADWDWILGVNVGGVVNGLQAVLPRIKATGEGGHIVNTASMAGLTAGAGMGVYNASKFAVVGLSEALRADLAETDIGVSVLCPAMVDTEIIRSERIRPEALADPGSDAAAEDQIERMRRAMAASIPPTRIGSWWLRAFGAVLAPFHSRCAFPWRHGRLSFSKPSARRRQRTYASRNAHGRHDPGGLTEGLIRLAQRQPFPFQSLPVLAGPGRRAA